MLLAHIATGQQIDIRILVTSGNLEDMRWPNFSDYRDSLQKFYAPTGYAPAWVQGSQPVPQALSLIERLQGCREQKVSIRKITTRRGGKRESVRCKARRWPGMARFDVALTVCTMRYVSDLRIGRINPQHFQFGLSVEQKKYDLAQFLRDRI